MAMSCFASVKSSMVDQRHHDNIEDILFQLNMTVMRKKRPMKYAIKCLNSEKKKTHFGMANYTRHTDTHTKNNKHKSSMEECLLCIWFLSRCSGLRTASRSKEPHASVCVCLNGTSDVKDCLSNLCIHC